MMKTWPWIILSFLVFLGTASQVKGSIMGLVYVVFGVTVLLMMGVTLYWDFRGTLEEVKQ